MKFVIVSKQAKVSVQTTKQQTRNKALTYHKIKNHTRQFTAHVTSTLVDDLALAETIDGTTADPKMQL